MAEYSYWTNLSISFSLRMFKKAPLADAAAFLLRGASPYTKDVFASFNTATVTATYVWSKDMAVGDAVEAFRADLERRLHAHLVGLGHELSTDPRFARHDLTA